MDPEKLHTAGNGELTASEFKFSYFFDVCLLLVPMTRSGGKFAFMIGCCDESLRKMLSRPSKRELQRVEKLHKKRIIDLVWSILTDVAIKTFDESTIFANVNHSPKKRKKST